MRIDLRIQYRSSVVSSHMAYAENKVRLPILATIFVMSARFELNNRNN